MRQDVLVTLHRAARALAPPLRPLKPVLRPFQRAGRRVFDRLVALRYARAGVITAEQNGRLWRLDPEVALRGPLQEFETILWLRQVTKPAMTVIDVGANVGQMSLEFGELVGKRGRVIAIEPAAGNVRVLRKHIVANGLDDRIEVVEAACAETHGGSATFVVLGDDTNAVGSGHAIAARATPELQAHPVTVPRVSVDGLCAERNLVPGVVKIDVEGAEIQVLEGAARTLRTARPMLRIGFHPFAFPDVEAASTRLRGLLLEHGYRFDGPASGPLELTEYVASPADG